MTSKKKEKCHDCGAEPGQKHTNGCDVERCSVCGDQHISCYCKGHDKDFARWTGEWPFKKECRMLGLYAKLTGNGWVPCDSDEKGAMPDLNAFYENGFHRAFVKNPHCVLLFVVQNKEGKFFHAKGFGGYGDTWVDTIGDAKFYTKISQARGRVSFFVNRWPEFGRPVIKVLLARIVGRVEEEKGGN